MRLSLLQRQFSALEVLLSRLNTQGVMACFTTGKPKRRQWNYGIDNDNEKVIWLIDAVRQFSVGRDRAINAYRARSVETATPGELVLMLFNESYTEHEGQSHVHERKRSDRDQ